MASTAARVLIAPGQGRWLKDGSREKVKSGVRFRKIYAGSWHILAVPGIAAKIGIQPGPRRHSRLHVDAERVAVGVRFVARPAERPAPAVGNSRSDALTSSDDQCYEDGGGGASRQRGILWRYEVGWPPRLVQHSPTRSMVNGSPASVRRARWRRSMARWRHDGTPGRAWLAGRHSPFRLASVARSIPLVDLFAPPMNGFRMLLPIEEILSASSDCNGFVFDDQDGTPSPMACKQQPVRRNLFDRHCERFASPARRKV